MCSDPFQHWLPVRLLLRLAVDVVSKDNEKARYHADREVSASEIDFSFPHCILYHLSKLLDCNACALSMSWVTSPQVNVYSDIISKYLPLFASMCLYGGRCSGACHRRRASNWLSSRQRHMRICIFPIKDPSRVTIGCEVSALPAPMTVNG
jgi:hypothetical protein